MMGARELSWLWDKEPCPPHPAAPAHPSAQIPWNRTPVPSCQSAWRMWSKPALPKACSSTSIRSALPHLFSPPLSFADTFVKLQAPVWMSSLWKRLLDQTDCSSPLWLCPSPHGTQPSGCQRAAQSTCILTKSCLKIVLINLILNSQHFYDFLFSLFPWYGLHIVCCIKNRGAPDFWNNFLDF